MASSCPQVVICLKIRTFVVSTTTCVWHKLHAVQLWFAWKFVPLWYQQQPVYYFYLCDRRCDLLENSYLCGINNNWLASALPWVSVVICLKIRTFVVSTTTLTYCPDTSASLWFAWKFVPLWYQQQHHTSAHTCTLVVICLKIRTFVVSTTTLAYIRYRNYQLWFAWKFVPLWYQQQH